MNIVAKINQDVRSARRVPVFLRQCSGRGFSALLSDTAAYFCHAGATDEEAPDYEDGRWLDALHAADRGNDGGLVALFLGEYPRSPRVGAWLVDYVDRQRLREVGKRKTGRTAAYAVTLQLAKLFAAVADVRDVMQAARRRGKPIKQAAAISAAAIRFGVTESALQAAVLGKHAGYNRARKRLRTAPTAAAGA